MTDMPQEDALFALPPLRPKGEAYRVLARKYRPQTFADMVGQDALVRTLTNAFESGRIAHAFMLTGVRGVGKTTTARIIAKALNCVGVDGKGGPTIEPCGQCDACTSIAADRCVDVLEMDAASRTGVDDVREIIESVRYAPTAVRTKVYIIDEVHMLSKNAFNALLKTLEEPPPHVKFIFATTEIRKVPVTVLSRCQRFDLRRIGPDILAPYFAKVAAAEGVNATEEALRLVARAADGSARDGLSLLDQAIARASGAVDGALVRDMLGLADRNNILDLLMATLAGKPGEALALFDSLNQAGADALIVVQDLLDAVHMLSRRKVLPDVAFDASLSESEQKRMSVLAEQLATPALARAWQVLLKGIGEVQMAPAPHKAAEMVLLRLAHASTLPTPGDLVRRLEGTTPGMMAAAHSQSAPSGAPVMRAAVGSTMAETMAMPQAQPQATSWPQIVALVAEHREAQLYSQLYSNVECVRVEWGRLELCPRPEAPPNIAPRLAALLSEWTDSRWVVTIANSPGRLTLAEEANAQEEAVLKAVAAHPHVQAVLLAFPGAKIEAIREDVALKPTDDAATTDDIPLDLMTDESED